MDKKILLILFFIAAVFMAGIFWLNAASNVDTMPQNVNEQKNKPSFAIALHSAMDHGEYLADEHGLPLYIFSQDVDGTSHCDNKCLASWPVFYKSEINLSGNLDTEDFDEIVRSDGQRQLTWRGWPLYYYIDDLQVGDFKGDGKNNQWFLAKPDYNFMVASDEQGSYVVDVDGRTLYSNDDCDEECQIIWPEYSVHQITSLPSIMQGMSEQLSNLHHYKGDLSRGEKKGLEFGNGWIILEM